MFLFLQTKKQSRLYVEMAQNQQCHYDYFKEANDK